jgi:hypothetical protein
MEAHGPWWGPWSSKPAWGVKSVPGVFDPHTPPPSHIPALPRRKNVSAGREGRTRIAKTEYSMQRRVLGTVSCAALLALALTGCTQIKQIVSPETPINRVTVEATSAVAGAPVTGKLASGMPKDLPLWPGAVVTKSKLVKSSLGNSWTATLSTVDPYADVLNGVGVGFQRANWSTEAQDTSSAEGSSTVLTVMGPSSDGLVTVTVTKTGAVEIGYVMTPKQQ